MERKKELIKNKNKLMDRIIKDYENQIEEVAQQITQEMLKHQKEALEEIQRGKKNSNSKQNLIQDSSKNQDKVSVSVQGMRSLISASSSMEQIKQINSIKSQTESCINVLKSEMNMDFIKSIPKLLLILDLIAQGGNLFFASIQKSINKYTIAISVSEQITDVTGEIKILSIQTGEKESSKLNLL